MDTHEIMKAMGMIADIMIHDGEIIEHTRQSKYIIRVIVKYDGHFYTLLLNTRRNQCVSITRGV